MRKLKLTTGEYYHVYNRGVEKRNIFLDHFDHRRLLTSLTELNQEGPVLNFGRLSGAKLHSEFIRKDSCRLVNIVCYCLMPNHFHLIIEQLADRGISNFMHKIGTSYTNYFNKKYGRSGVLFQGTYKAKHIDNDAYLLHLSRYIHLNPLELMNISKTGLKDLKTLENYPWSSLSSYLGYSKKGGIDLESVIVKNQFQTIEQYRDFLRSQIDDSILEHLKLD